MDATNERKPFLLRLDPATMAAVKAWAADDLRSLNGQIEFLLRIALREAGRLPSQTRRRQADADLDADRSEPSGERGTQRLRSSADPEPTGPGRVTR